MTSRSGSARHRAAGFTLIELLVVIVILGILAAIAVPVFRNQRNKGFDARAKSEMHSALIAFKTYYAEAQTFSDEATVMAALEPSVTWLKSKNVTTNNPAVDAVGFETSQAGADTVVVTIRSRSNRCFHMRIVEDTNLLPKGVTYLSLPPEAVLGCRDPWDKTSDIVRSGY